MSKEKVKRDLHKIIRKELSSDLTYHGIHHTEDVYNVCLFYIDHYSLKKKDSELLEIAAVGHDIGFTQTYINHEQVGAEITTRIMKKYGYSTNDMDVVTQLILATKIPQTPNSFLAQIICDADLDYLGRNDFLSIGLTLKEEWANYEIVPNLEEEFDNIQIGFLKKHFYHTDYAASKRSPVKIKNLAALERKYKKSQG